MLKYFLYLIMRKSVALLLSYLISDSLVLAEPDSVVMQRGRAVYSRTCLACHQPTGLGLPPVFPPLAGSEWVVKDASTAVRIILNGMHGPITVRGVSYNAICPPVTGLTNQDMADVVTYVANSWGNRGPSMTKEEVMRLRAIYKPGSADEVSAEIGTKPAPISVAEPKKPSRPPAPSKLDRPRGFGSGMVFTEKGHVFTNHHVIKDYSKYYIVTFENGILKQKIPAFLVKKDPQSDLVILQCHEWIAPARAPKLPPPIVPSQQCKMGAQVFVLGFPLPGTVSSNVKYTNGYVSDMSGLRDDSREIQHTAQIQPGNSGGPMALSDGRIVGIVVSSLNESFALRSSGALPQGVNFSVKSDYLLTLAAIAEIKLPQGRAGSDPIEHVKAYTVQIMCEE